MDIERYECIVGRILDYLSRSGIELTPQVVREALKVVEDCLDRGGDDVLQRAFDRLPRHFDLPVVGIPRVAPPVHRSSIRYRRGEPS